MTLTLTWHGHATWAIEFVGKRILVDPFFDQNPAAKAKASEIDSDLILVTHGHADHIADAVSIARRTKAMVVCVYEIAEWLGKQGVTEVTGMNLGGSFLLPYCNVKMVPALHSSTLPDGSNGGVPAGFVLTIGGKRIYIAGDTAFFSDMSLVGQMEIEVAILPIGDLYTMGIDDSVLATQAINPRFVLPSHFNTWPTIAQDAKAWAHKIKSETPADPIILAPGAAHQFASFKAAH